MFTSIEYIKLNNLSLIVFVCGICFNVSLVEGVLKRFGSILNMSKVITYRVHRYSMFFSSMTLGSEKISELPVVPEILIYVQWWWQKL